jgi:hypothetical protein
MYVPTVIRHVIENRHLPTFFFFFVKVLASLNVAVCVLLIENSTDLPKSMAWI